jgi:cytoskeletal protein RodZ
MSTFGEELSRERKLRGIRLREVSDATKINLRYLEALEGNDFEHLPGGVFNRGFVRAYSQYIGIDPDAMVNAYLLEEQAQKAGGKNRNSQLLRRSRNIDDENEQEERDGGKTGRHPLVLVAWIVVVLLLLLALGWTAARYMLNREVAENGPAEISAPDDTGGREQQGGQRE